MKSYHLYITPSAWAELRRLPGNVRKRLRREIDALAMQPAPHAAKQLDYQTGSNAVLYRLRIDKWRIVYAVDDDASLLRVVAIRRRPPYDYGDLEILLEGIL